MKTKVLLIEDDATLSEVLQMYMEHHDFAVHIATDGLSGIVKATQIMPDIVLLDHMLPKASGLEVCQQLRTFTNIPIIMVSARGDEQEKVECFEAGADDYVTKPFSQRELISRMKAHLRRKDELLQAILRPTPDEIRFEDFVINKANYKVMILGEEVTFTKKEFLILWTLAKRPNEIVPRKHVLQQVWGYSDSEDDRVIDTHVNRVRSKLKQYQSPALISTVWGMGYRLEVKSS
jgi:two-component system response regulator ResD